MTGAEAVSDDELATELVQRLAMNPQGLTWLQLIGHGAPMSVDAARTERAMRALMAADVAGQGPVPGGSDEHRYVLSEHGRDVASGAQGKAALAARAVRIAFVADVLQGHWPQ